MALGLGLDEDWFWRSTPYLTQVAMRGLSKSRIEGALYTGWFAERFAREERLQGPQHYVDEFLTADGGPEAQEAMAEAELARMALAWGLELEDLDDGRLDQEPATGSVSE